MLSFFNNVLKIKIVAVDRLFYYDALKTKAEAVEGLFFPLQSLVR